MIKYPGIPFQSGICTVGEGYTWSRMEYCSLNFDSLYILVAILEVAIGNKTMRVFAQVSLPLTH